MRMSFQKNSFKHTSLWQLGFREIINKKGKASFETDAAVAKPGQRRRYVCAQTARAPVFGSKYDLVRLEC